MEKAHEIENGWICKSCNRKNPLYYLYCLYCGNQSENRLICKNCSRIVPEKYRFCIYCGKYLEHPTPLQDEISTNEGGTEMTKLEVTVQDWEFMKEKIEEITHSKVGVEKLKQDVKTLESSKTVVEMVETSYQKTIRTEYFLDKLKLLGSYTDGQSGRLTNEINGFRRFLKEELFEYVDEEHKVDVRSFCRNLLDIWIAEVLKER